MVLMSKPRLKGADRVNQMRADNPAGCHVSGGIVNTYHFKALEAHARVLGKWRDFVGYQTKYPDLSSEIEVGIQEIPQEAMKMFMLYPMASVLDDNSTGGTLLSLPNYLNVFIAYLVRHVNNSVPTSVTKELRAFVYFKDIAAVAPWSTKQRAKAVPGDPPQPMASSSAKRARSHSDGSDEEEGAAGSSSGAVKKRARLEGGGLSVPLLDFLNHWYPLILVRYKDGAGDDNLKRPLRPDPVPLPGYL
ncbi:hypothetical protein DFH08DRAFT_1087653 [Mycena albidolilacea]|uniref:Uncharacterized protein n=1 Tax=Mycena albidolilacea TaxID=1033008 RepID=A0AAD6Z9I3_9AGAR|nr:hypothetical protein DFH08DRAFT_1087653 [Mycena albidolilacea]